MAHTLDVDKVPDMVDEMLNSGKLRGWPLSFCESVKAQLEEGRKLSDRQLEKLEEIWQGI
jgi:hypothetical protein